MDILQSPKARILILKFLGYLALLSIIDKVLKNNSADVFMLVVLILSAVVNDYFRESFRKKSRKTAYFISYAISIVIVEYVIYKIGYSGGTGYLVILFVELIVLNRKISISLCILNFISYFLISFISTNFTEYNIINSLSGFIEVFLIAFLFRSITMQKIKTDSINNELKTANEKLKEYSRNIKELTVAKERARIAQELHDSIGHSLVALGMNLEYAENIIDSKPEKAKEVIGDAFMLSKDCLSNLRKAVSLLKESVTVQSLRISINEVFQKFKPSNKVRFSLNMEEEIEASGIEIKDCVFKTIREAVTNGIKHGDAENFKIDIKKIDSNIFLTIYNDGKSSSDIVKSNGITGIENRIKRLDGRVEFNSESNKGFTIEAVIPERKEQMI